MIISMLVIKIKSFFLCFINLFRRALCCFRRRRRMSGDVEPLSHIVVSETGNSNENEQWNDWEFTHRKPSSVQEHIEFYRQQQSKLLKQQSQEDEEAQVQSNQDLFEDMTPKITKQRKVLVENSTEKGYSLDVHPDAANFVSNQLEDWEDESGWDKDSLDWDAQELLRQKKRQERERRLWEQQQKRIEKSNRPNALGAKIAS